MASPPNGQPVASSSKVSQRSNPIFDQAVQEHLQRLQPWERADFTSSTPEGVRSLAAEYHASHRKSRLLRCVQRISKVIEPLEMFFSAVDNGVSSHPEIAGIVWGALRFVMQTIRGVSAYFSRIGDILEDIAEALPHYQDYAVTLFSTSKRVMEGLAGVYGDILLTCTTIRRIYKNAQGIRGSLCVSARALNPWDHAFDDVVASLRQRRERLNERVRHEEMLIAHEQRKKDGEAQRLREEKEREREAEEKRRRVEKEQRRLREEKEAKLKEAREREKERLRELSEQKREFLELLQKSTYAECHSKHEACRGAISQHLNAGRWLLERPEFEQWADSSDSSSGMLWLRGKAGAGKTILSFIVANTLSAQVDAASGRRTVAYFYCQYDDPQKRSDSRIVLGTLLHQVISQLPADISALGQPDTAPPDHDALENMLSSLARHSKNVVLIVDALDEFDASGRRKLIQALKRLSREAKVFLTSRELLPSQFEDDTLDLLRDVPIVLADPEHVNGDIIKFVYRNVRCAGEDNSDTLDDPEPPLQVGTLTLRDEIRKALAERADGMFLYVRLQILHLRRQGTEHDVRTALKSLPSGISATFMRALRDIEALPLQRRDRIRRLFRWLICSPTAPLLKDIMETVVIDDMGDEWDPSRCIARPSSLIEDCANLVVATSLVSDTNSSHSGEETSADQMLTSTVQFIHASVREFLLSESSSPEEAPLPAYHYYPLSAAHLPLVLTGFKYYEVSNTLKLRERRDSHMTEAWYTHLRLAGDDGRHLISQFRQFLNPASSTRIKWVEAYNELHPNFELCDDPLPLHHIAIALNLRHIVPELVRHSRTLETWSSSRDLENVNERNDDGHTSLHVAAAVFEEYEDAWVMRFLLDEGANVAATDNIGRTALHVASTKRASHVPLEMLLDYGADVHATDDEGRTALHLVALASVDADKAILILLRWEADVDATDHSGRTPLLSACSRATPGHSDTKASLDTVRMLFAHGAIGDVVDHAGKTTLHLVAENSPPLSWFRRVMAFVRTSRWVAMEELLQMLLSHGADLHAADALGKRAVEYAQYKELYQFLQTAAGEDAEIDKDRFRRDNPGMCIIA